MKNFVATYDNRTIEFSLERVDSRTIKVVSKDHTCFLDVQRLGKGHYSVLHGARSHDVSFYRNGTGMWQAFTGDVSCHFELLGEKDRRRPGATGGLTGGSGEVKSPMPGKVVKVEVSEGQTVSAGDGVVVVEAMKMQNELRSRVAGVVRKINVREGDSVEGGAVLVVIS